MLGRVLLLLATLSLIVSGCSAPTGKQETRQKLRAVTTVGMVADTVRNVSGDRLEVVALMGPGVDPHLYKPSEGDIIRLAEADVIFYGGLHLEGKMGLILERIARAGRRVVAVTDGIDRSLLIQLPNAPGQYDPHVWFDVSLWALTIQTVVDAVAALDPAGKDLYQANGDRYREKLLELHDYCRQKIGSIPKQQRVLITAHDAFGYFGRAYDIEVVGLQGMSTTSEYGLGDLRRLVELIVTRGIKAVFVESSVPKRSIEAVVAGCKARGHEIHIGGELFSDAMGEPDTPAGTYIGMIRHNVDAIVQALK